MFFPKIKYLYKLDIFLKINNKLFIQTFTHLLLFFPLLWETDSVPSAEATMYSGEPSLIVILLMDC